jgi:hypothetical protein
VRGIFRFRALGTRIVSRIFDGLDVFVGKPAAGWVNPPVACHPRHALQPGTFTFIVVFFAETTNFIALFPINGEKLLDHIPR